MVNPAFFTFYCVLIGLVKSALHRRNSACMVRMPPISAIDLYVFDIETTSAQYVSFVAIFEKERCRRLLKDVLFYVHRKTSNSGENL